MTLSIIPSLGDASWSEAWPLVVRYGWPVITAAVGGCITYYFAKRLAISKLTADESRQRHDAVRDALGRYADWLVMLRAYLDPQDLAGLGHTRDIQDLSDAHRLGRVLDENRHAGLDAVKRLEDASYVFLVSRMTKSLSQTNQAVLRFWGRVQAGSWPVDGYGVPAYGAWLLSRDAPGLTQLDAKETYQAQAMVEDLRSLLHAAHAKQTMGKRARRTALKGSCASCVQSNRRGELSYDGPIPFESDEYRAELERPLGEVLLGQTGQSS